MSLRERVELASVTGWQTNTQEVSLPPELLPLATKYADFANAAYHGKPWSGFVAEAIPGELDRVQQAYRDVAIHTMNMAQAQRELDEKGISLDQIEGTRFWQLRQQSLQVDKLREGLLNWEATNASSLLGLEPGEASELTPLANDIYNKRLAGVALEIMTSDNPRARRQLDKGVSQTEWINEAHTRILREEAKTKPVFEATTTAYERATAPRTESVLYEVRQFTDALRVKFSAENIRRNAEKLFQYWQEHPEVLRPAAALALVGIGVGAGAHLLDHNPFQIVPDAAHAQEPDDNSQGLDNSLVVIKADGSHELIDFNSPEAKAMRSSQPEIASNATAEQRWEVLLCRASDNQLGLGNTFKDLYTPMDDGSGIYLFPSPEYIQLLLGDRETFPSIAHFFAQMGLHFTTRYHSQLKMPHPRDYYYDTEGQFKQGMSSEFLTDCIITHDPYINYADPVTKGIVVVGDGRFWNTGFPLALHLDGLNPGENITHYLAGSMFPHVFDMSVVAHEYVHGWSYAFTPLRIGSDSYGIFHSGILGSTFSTQFCLMGAAGAPVTDFADYERYGMAPQNLNAFYRLWLSGQLNRLREISQGVQEYRINFPDSFNSPDGSPALVIWGSPDHSRGLVFEARRGTGGLSGLAQGTHNYDEALFDTETYPDIANVPSILIWQWNPNSPDDPNAWSNFMKLYASANPTASGLLGAGSDARWTAGKTFTSAYLRNFGPPGLPFTGAITGTVLELDGNTMRLRIEYQKGETQVFLPVIISSR